MKFYVLEQSIKNNRVEIAIHADVSTGSNAASKPWQDIIKELRVADELVGVSSVTWLTNAEMNKLNNGALFELLFTFEDDANLADSERIANLTAAVGVRVNEFAAEFANRFRYYGLEVTI